MICNRKICLVIPSLQAGGMERVMSEVAWYLAAKEGIETHLVLYGITREVFYPIPDNIIIHEPSFQFNNKWRKYYSLKTLLFLRTTIKNINPGGTLSFGEYWNSFFLLSVIGLRFPRFISDRSEPGKRLGWFHDNLRKFLYKKADGIIFQTEKAREIFFKSNYHPNTVVVGNPIRKIKETDYRFKKTNSILMVGRLIKSKNQDQLIRMFARVSPPEWNLVLVGYDHLKQNNMEKLITLAKELNIGNRVIFAGKKENVEELYLSSSIFAFTSSSEGFPNAIGEAMAAGLPVVAYDCVAGPSEIIIDGYNGFLIPLFDTGQFEKKLTLLINDGSLRSRFGENAKESIKRFSRDTICEKFFKFITTR